VGSAYDLLMLMLMLHSFVELVPYRSFSMISQ
jgi:hypothetical protein